VMGQATPSARSSGFNGSVMEQATPSASSSGFNGSVMEQTTPSASGTGFNGSVMGQATPSARSSGFNGSVMEQATPSASGTGFNGSVMEQATPSASGTGFNGSVMGQATPSASGTGFNGSVMGQAMPSASSTGSNGSLMGQATPSASSTHSNGSLMGPHVPTSTPSSTPDATGYVREYSYLPDGKPAQGSPAVDCQNWDTADEGQRRDIVTAAMRELQASGYVVLERLLPTEGLVAAREAFRRYKARLPYGVRFGRMRAKRDMTIPPFEDVFKEDWLVRHPLVMTLLARHLRNSVDIRNDGAAQMEIAQWIASGSPLDYFETGPASGGFPVLDLMTVVDTPPGAPAQTRHRDTILPGPCASLGVHIPLRPLQLSPLNGSIGFTPGSHRNFGDACDKRDVVGAVPFGSVILYDSFTEHHGLENESSEPREAMFAWFRVPGVYSGHTDENFGEAGLELAVRWRKYLQPHLNQAIEAERRNCPSQVASGPDADAHFKPDSELVPWGEERVCFARNVTTGDGAYHEGLWYCKDCWSESSRCGQQAPVPDPANIAAPSNPDRLSEEWLIEQESKGMNIRPSRGRHKLTLLRERGLFLPIDPSAKWLAGVSTEPQPENWKQALRDGVARHEDPTIPRHDGFDT